MIVPRRPAGLIRRATALFLDMMVAILPIALLSLLPGLIVPLDGAGGILMMIVSLPLVPFALGYFYLGCGVLPNTIGRRLVGVRVRDEATGGRPGVKQAVLRSLTAGLWPVEALMIAFSDSKRRLGDRLAGTVVERYAPEASRRERLVWAVAGPTAGMALLLLLNVGVVARMDVTRAAKAYAARELGGARGLVLHATNDGDAGHVVLDTRAAGRSCVELEREDDEWSVTDVRPAPTREQMGGVPLWMVGADVCGF